MTPINQTERRKAFWNFLLFFVITIGIVITALAFSFQVPFKENDKLRKQISATENEKIFLQSFEAKMFETTKLLDSVNQVDMPYWIESRIKKNIEAMIDMNDNDSISGRNIFDKIIRTLQDLQVAKEEIRNHNKNNAESGDKDITIKDLKTDLTSCKNRVDNLLLELAKK